MSGATSGAVHKTLNSGEIGVGLAGYGLAGRVFHGPLVAHTQGLRVSAVFSRTPERRAEAGGQYGGIAEHPTYEELLDDPSVQLVVVGTPHDTHEAMVIQALQAGKHVVVDKIMCLSVAQGQRMIAAARDAKRVLSIFHNRRWDSDYLTLRSVIDQGLIGEPYVFESAVTSAGPSQAWLTASSSASERPRGWRSYAEFGGGPMRDWGAHLFDQAVQLAGPRPETVYADLHYRREWDVETAGVAHLRYAPEAGKNEGMRFVIETGAISAIQRPRWYVRGSEGAYLQYGRDAQEDALKRGEVGPRVMDAEHAPRVTRYVDGQLKDVPVEQVPGNYLAYYANVRDALRGESDLAVRPENVLHSIRIIEDVFRSAETRQIATPRGAPES